MGKKNREGGLALTDEYRDKYWVKNISFDVLFHDFLIFCGSGDEKKDKKLLFDLIHGAKKLDVDYSIVDDEWEGYLDLYLQAKKKIAEQGKEIQRLKKELSEHTKEIDRSQFFSDESVHHGFDDYDYGWLEPNGIFHKTGFGDHESFAFHWLLEHEGDDELCFDLHNGDTLVEKYGWILLHNPCGAEPYAYISQTRHTTKAQREFLYDYFMQYGMKEEAEKCLEEG